MRKGKQSSWPKNSVTLSGKWAGRRVKSGGRPFSIASFWFGRSLASCAGFHPPLSFQTGRPPS